MVRILGSFLEVPAADPPGIRTSRGESAKNHVSPLNRRFQRSTYPGYKQDHALNSHSRLYRRYPYIPSDRRD